MVCACPLTHLSADVRERIRCNVSGVRAQNRLRHRSHTLGLCQQRVFLRLFISCAQISSVFGIAVSMNEME